ncbi:MAG: response regulator, partial [Calditrichaeota bacterium]|nr:response regulator [Calditrichota bacterium]
MTVTNPVPSLLLVDDDAVFRRLMSALFQQDGFQVTAFESAETAFDALELRTFKVAIVDYKLPDLNGIDFFERTRRSHPDMVRILITAHTTEEVLLDAINRGEVYRYLNKPVHTGLLRSTVEQALVLNELTTSRNMILASLDERNRELEQKNSDLARFNHLLGEL